MYKKDVTIPAWFLLLISCLGSLLLSGQSEISTTIGGGDSMERREEKVKAFREKRDRFFKEDPHSPLKESDRKKFKGLRYYPFDLQFAMVGTIERYPIEPKPLYARLPTSRGTEKKYVKYGRFKFSWMGKEYVLQIYRPLGGGELFLAFKDMTSESETYSKGRDLFIEPMPGGKVLIDFNRAYNPFCEYNERYTCTFAPEENWLKIAIRAGEKRFRWITRIGKSSRDGL
jgi:uncharacterized protein (DUF1684 family)